jgi:hypothetical protein
MKIRFSHDPNPPIQVQALMRDFTNAIGASLRE